MSTSSTPPDGAPAAWSGRFSEPVSEIVKRYTASIPFDYRLAEFDIQGSLAHAAMLHHVGVLSKDDLEAIPELPIGRLAERQLERAGLGVGELDASHGRPGVRRVAYLPLIRTGQHHRACESARLCTSKLAQFSFPGPSEPRDS